MKRIIALALSAALLLTLAACGKKPEETAPPETTAAPAEPATESTTVPTEPAPTEPAWEPAEVRAGDLGILYQVFQRGDKVTVLGEVKDYFVIEGEEADLMIEARFLRPEGEEVPAEDDGWAKGKVPVYPTAYLQGEPIATLSRNTKVKVLDAKANWMLIEWKDGTGYVEADQISPWSVQGGGGGSSGNSKPKDGTDVNVGSLSAVQGDSYEVVTLGVYSGPTFEKYDSPKEGVILSAETEGYLCVMIRGNEVKITEVGEETCSVLVNGVIGTVPRWAVRLEGDADYESWTGYAKRKAKAYTEYQQRNQLRQFNQNEQILVVDELEEVELYVVEIEGEIGYMKLDSLQKTRWKASGGGGSSSGSSSGSGWTPPKL